MGIDAQCDPETPGCMGVNGVLTSGGIASESVRRELIARRFGLEARLRERFDRAKQEGDLRPDTDTTALTAYVFALAQGLALQASAGLGLADLRNVVTMALTAWPWGGGHTATA